MVAVIVVAIIVVVVLLCCRKMRNKDKIQVLAPNEFNRQESEVELKDTPAINASQPTVPIHETDEDIGSAINIAS